MADLFDVVVARKLSGGGGGGGSSDFSTVTVTIAMLRGQINIPFIYDEGGDAGLLNYGITESGTYNVPTYKGFLIGSISAEEQTIQVSGNAEYDPDSSTIIVTGDCTITIS